MTKTIVYISAVMAMVFSLMSQADQRFESEQNMCHFAYDPNNDDNEVYLGNCQNSIDTYDAGDGQGALAYGTSKVKHNYLTKSGTTPKLLLKGGNRVIRLKGADSADLNYLAAHREAVNTECVMVTSNYDNNTGTNNYTEYRTNDWTLDITIQNQQNKLVKVAGVNTVAITIDVVYDLSCRRGVAQ